MMGTSSVSFLITVKLALSSQHWLGNDLPRKAVGTKKFVYILVVNLADPKSGEATGVLFSALGSSRSAHWLYTTHRKMVKISDISASEPWGVSKESGHKQGLSWATQSQDELWSLPGEQNQVSLSSRNFKSTVAQGRNCSGFLLVPGRDGAHKADFTGRQGIVLSWILAFLCLSSQGSVQEKPKYWVGLKAVLKESPGASDISWFSALLQSNSHFGAHH